MQKERGGGGGGEEPEGDHILVSFLLLRIVFL